MAVQDAIAMVVGQIAKDKWPNGRMSERQLTERTYGPKTNDRMDIWQKDIRPKRHLAERTNGRKS